MSEIEPTLADTWAAAYHGDPSATIRPESSAGEPSAAMAELLSHPDGRDELAFGSTIGTGGMGIVRTAEQVRLHRTVAVKSLRTDISDPEATRKLLAEAWMTGALEHPNIVPIYDIAVDDGHRPHIVMKRITGIEWESVMDDGAAVAERFGTHDLLAWNLGILMAVCNALHFAHARGIVHRDVKPQNVMVGEFGEVYLVDWGIAVPLHDDGRIPSVGGGRIAGTPRYMAPEMVRAEPVTVATDVYLMGGVLHRILTGAPPHRGWSIKEILEGIDGFAPSFGAEVPEELAQLVRDAMAAEPSERPSSAEHFRQRLATFLEHRGSTRIAEQAQERLNALQAELAGDRNREAIYGHLGACRFGFQEALRGWPGNEPANTGLRGALTAVLEYELEARDPRAATLLLAELEDPAPELSARLEALRAEVEGEERRLRSLQIDQDPRIGQRTRVFVVGVLALFWVLSPLAGWYMDRELTSWNQLGFGFFILLLVGSFLIWARESFMATPMNRATGAMLIMVPLCKIAAHAVFYARGADYRTASITELLMYLTIGMSVTMTFEKRLFPTTLAFALAAATMAVTDIHPLLLIAAADAVLLVNALIIWLPGLPREPTLRPDRDERVG